MKVLRITILFCFFLLAANAGMAQLILTNGTPSRTIDFSNNVATQQTTVGTNPISSFAGAGFSPAPLVAGRLNSNAWASTGWSEGTLAFGGTQAASTDFGRGVTAVAVTQGGIYAYTGSPHSPTDPALMIQPGGSDFSPGTLTLRIQNNGSTLMNQLAVSYNIYVRNDQARSNSFNFSYSSDNVTYTPVAALDYATPGAADGSGWVPVAGAPSRATNITGINITPGSFFYIRWTSDDISGTLNRDEIGLDDINLTAAFAGACTPPMSPATLFTINNVYTTQMDIDFQRGNGTGGLLIVATQGTTLTPAALTVNPTSGVTYAANSNFGTGAPIGVGNGFAVYNSNVVPPFGVGTFTMTGLLPNTFYSLYYFEYNTSVICYDLSLSDVTDQQTANFSATAPTDQFRSLVSGDWANAHTWQSSNDGVIWVTPAQLAPTFSSAGISIMSGHTVNISCPVSMDQTSIAGGTLTLSNDGRIDLNNGAGNDIDILAGGVLKIQSTQNYSSTFAFTGIPATPRINVSSGLPGGKITIGNGGTAPGYSALGYTPNFVIWNNASILEWNSTDPFITAGGITYFPDAPEGTIPIFRISRSPSLQPGSIENTGWNGLLEVNSDLALRLGGTKTFRNGIIGSDTLYQEDNCGQFVINGATAQLGGTGVIILNAGGLAINSTSLTSMTSAKTINSTVGAGLLIVNNGGTLYCSDHIMSGTGLFTVAAGGTLGIGSSLGISSAGATGNIQVLGLRTFNTAANYLYNGTVNQLTGIGLPVSIIGAGTLTISNTGTALNNTVTLTTNNTTVPTFNLSNGLFESGTAQQLNISSGGTVNGTGGNHSQSSAAGIISFATTGIGMINPGTGLSLTNVDLNGGVNMGGGNTSIKGTLNIKAGGYVIAGTAPTYSSSPASTLLYSCGCNYGAGEEWYENNFGTSPGVPHHVTLAAGTSMNFTTAGFTREMRGNLTINTGSTFALSTTFGGDLYIKGNWIKLGTGLFNPNNRAVKFNGSGNSTITANNGEVFDYLILEKDATGTSLSLIDNISISKEFQIITGTFDLASKNATLLSNASATASFAKMTAAGNINYGTGRFVVERYIPSGVSHAKSWQFLAVPTNNAGQPGGQTVNAAWQEGAATANANPVPGYGTQITSDISPLPSMFDVLTPLGPTMKTYNPATNGWTGIANTTTLPVYNQKGYMVFVRGNRLVTTFNGAANATILRTTGKIFDPVSNIPPVTNVGANEFESIGNPYASAINFSNDLAVIKSANVQKVFYVWDPKLGGTYGYGRYQTFTKGAGTDYTVSPGGGSYGAGGSVNNIIQSGQAFFVRSVAGAGTVSFTEDAKVSGSNVTFKPSNGVDINDKQLRNNLYVIIAGNPILIDGVLNQFDQGYSNKLDILDALKLANSGENIGISRDNKILVVERRAEVVNTDTIFYNLGQMMVQQYQLEFVPDNLSKQGLEAFLEDSYLKTSTAISLSDTTHIGFNVTNEPGSYATGRFRLVFIQKYIPVKYTDIQAGEQNRNIAVTWQVSDENDINRYEVERSHDGINFTGVHTETVNIAGAGSYSWMDTDPFTGTNFYRIRSVNNGNEISYSSKVIVFFGKGNAAGFVIYPNPVKDGLIGLQLYQLPAGAYSLKLFSSTGQLVFSKTLYHTGGNSIQQVQAGTRLGKGVYRLEMNGPAGLRQAEKLIID